MYTITGCLRSTPPEYLSMLAEIAVAYIRTDFHTWVYNSKSKLKKHTPSLQLRVNPNYPHEHFAFSRRFHQNSLYLRNTF